MYHSLLIHFSVVGHLGCSQFGTIKNKPAVNIHVHMSMDGHVFPFLSGKYLGVEWLDQLASVCLAF